MPISLPTQGQRSWGPSLNSWLQQLGPTDKGGLHNGNTASRPSGLTTDDEGRMYIDTESQEVVRWNGSSWDVLLSGSSSQNFTITPKTTDYTITSSEATTGLNGFSNDGATGTITFTLPEATAGYKLTIINSENQEVRIQSVGDDLIYLSGNPVGASSVSSTAKASAIELYCINGTEWVVNTTSSWTGTYSDPDDFTANPADYAGSIQVGWKIGGGWVVQTDGTTGLIVAPSDESTALQWKTGNTASAGTDSTTDGAANTAAMTDVTHPAANACATKTLHGYSDWYLPARDQLTSIYNFWVGTGYSATYGFYNTGYWSSTQQGASFAWYRRFTDGSQPSRSKITASGVRAVRSF